jgi:soluble lytic murein transglycosylase-like protein
MRGRQVGYSQNPVDIRKTGLIMSGIGIFLLGLFGGKKVVDKKRQSRVLNVITKWKPSIISAASAQGIPASLLASVVAQESDGIADAYRYEPAFYDRYIKNNSDWIGHKYHGSPKIISASYGLCQLMFTTAYETADRELKARISANAAILYDVGINLGLGAKLIKKLMTQYGNRRDTLAAYNAGKGCVKTHCWRGYQYAGNVIALEDSIPTGAV